MFGTGPDQGAALQLGAVAAVNQGVSTADGASDEQDETEKDIVKKVIDEYSTARKFDEGARRQYNQARRYASGGAVKNWASTANIIGAHIDILTSYTYAKDPDVSVRPSEQAGGFPSEDQADFAETLQIVIPRLWKDGKLKARARRGVRSVLSVGPGWLKVVMFEDGPADAQMEKDLKSCRDNIERIDQLQIELQEDQTDEDARTAKLAELQEQETGLQGKVESATRRGLAIDFVRAEDMQVSLDVTCLSDYVDAGWVSNDLYIRKDMCRTRFPRITADDLKQAAIYYQTQTAPTARDGQEGGVWNEPTFDNTTDTGAFTKANADGTARQGANVLAEGGENVEFVKVVEQWCRNESVIKTFVDGIKKWAREPYAPPQASTRFYPYFLIEFYPVDGERHPQSLTERELKLQDEYSSRRSNGRLARERSIPKTIFNKGLLSPEDAKAIQNGQNMEMIGVQISDPLADVGKIVSVLAAPGIDGALYDTSDVQRDMEVISGVGEAQQQTPRPGVTATAVDAGQAGFASRTDADRDMLEEMLNDLALYTAQVAIQALTPEDVARIAGPLAFWPADMDVEDVLAMLTVEIVAGTTGKPKARQDKETWATLLPIVREFITIIPGMEATGDPVLIQQAKGFRNLLRETLKRMDDRMSIDAILPPMMKPKLLQTPAGPGNPAGEPTPSPMTGEPGSAGPAIEPAGNGTINKIPTATAPVVA